MDHTYENGCTLEEIESLVSDYISAKKDEYFLSADRRKQAIISGLQNDLNQLRIQVRETPGGGATWSILPYLDEDMAIYLDGWLRRDLWSPREAALILSDVLPGTETIITHSDGFPELTECSTLTYKDGQRGCILRVSEFKSQNGLPLFRIQNSFEEKMELFRLTFGEKIDQTALAPAAWVLWAIDKRFEINWIEHAFRRGFLLEVQDKIEASEFLTRRYLRPRRVLGLVDDKPSVTVTTAEEKPLLTTVRNSLLKMVIGMAIDGYGYDPAAKKSSIPKEIADALDRRGIGVTDDTVRTYLKEAAQTVLPETQPKSE